MTGLALLLCSASLGSAQISVTGLADRTYEYDTSKSFTVNATAGYDYLAVLDTNAIPIGQQITVTQADYHELRVWATNQSNGAVSSGLFRFNVTVNERGTSENGLPPWTYYPTIPSAAAEFAGAHLRLIVPQDFPAGYPIPVIAWVDNDGGHAVRANGWLTAAGHPGIKVKRGVGSGFLGATNAPGPLSYAAQIGGLQSSPTIHVEANTAWTTVSGVQAPDAVWAENSRIHVTGNLAIPAGGTLTVGAGTIVRVNPTNDIQNSGQIVINGTTTRPVVFMPATPGQPWGGFIQHANNAGFTATGAIFTGSGYRNCWFKGHECASGLYPIDSHRGQQALISLQGANCNLSMTDCAAIYLAGQFGHSASEGANSSQITLTRTLVQRCITGGEYSKAVLTVNDSAFLEFADDPSRDESPEFVDGDNDGLYITGSPAGQSHGFTNTLFGWAKDDGIDSGGSGAGVFNYQNCWFESVAHEGNSLSGADNASPHNDKIVNHYDGVFINCGQGLEDGYGAPTGSVQRCLMLGNMVGARFGDNYNWTYYGFLTVKDSILVHNYRDVWGVNFQDWTYRVSSMDVRDNYLTVPNPNHPDNNLWDPATLGEYLKAFMTTPPAAPVGISFATWDSQGDITQATNRLPVRLSSFTPNDVTVSYAAKSSTGATLDSGTLTFTPGETVKWIAPNIANPQAHDLIGILLGNPVNGEITGKGGFYYVNAGSTPTTPLVSRGARWRYRDAASAAPAGWNLIAFDDGTWPEGAAQLGFSGGEEGDEATPIADNNQITSYFRHGFNVTDPTAFASLSMWLLRDDGGVVYLNGNEVFRSPNLPAYPAAISYSTTTAAPNGENTIDTATIASTNLQAGTNLVAVEIHQQSATSSDVSFNFELTGQPVPSVNLANFGETLLMYWFDTTYVLQEASTINGTWTTAASASPWAVQPATGQKFYRLRKL